MKQYDMYVNGCRVTRSDTLKLDNSCYTMNMDNGEGSSIRDCSFTFTMSIPDVTITMETLNSLFYSRAYNFKGVHIPHDERLDRVMFYEERRYGGK